MKKLLSIFLVIAMLVTTCTVSVSAVTYTDISGHWAENEIEAWSDYGVISGYDGQFSPDRHITRGEFAVVLGRLMGYQKESGNAFSDLPEKFYTSYVLKLYNAGVMQGYEGFIRPEASLTREEASVMICRALGINQADTMNRDFVDEADVSDWSKGYINAMVNSGLLNGTDGNLNPQKPISRAEVVKILDNAVRPILKAGTFENIDTGKIVLVSVGGVTIKDSEIAGTVIVTQGAVNGNITFTNSKIGKNFVIDNDRSAFIKVDNTTVVNKEILNHKAFIKESTSGGGGGGGISSTTTTYTVTFKVNNRVIRTSRITSGSTIGIQMPADPEVVGYIFCGWKDVVTGNPVTSQTVVTGAMIVEAILEADTGSGDTTGGTTGGSGETTGGTGDSTTGGTTTGGSTTGGTTTGGTEAPPEEPEEPEETVYTVTFKVNGKIYSIIEVTGDTAIGEQMPENPRISGYAFQCWRNAATGDAVTADTIVSSTMLVNAYFIYGSGGGGGGAVGDRHQWDEGVITTPATCTENGVKKFVCTECGQTKTQIIPANGHAYGEWEKETERYHKKECTVCGAYVRAIHKFDEGVITTPATCTEWGVRTLTCQICSCTLTREIPAGHTYGEWEYEDEDYHKKECTRGCGETIREEHDWEKGTSVSEEITGIFFIKTYYKCEICGETKEEINQPEFPEPPSIPARISVNTNGMGVTAGLEIEIPVILWTVSGLKGLTLDFTYDENVFSYVGAEQGEALGTLQLTKPDSEFEEGNLTFSWSGENVDTTNGEILIVKLKVNEIKRAGSYRLGAIIKEASDENISAVEIEGYGDVFVYVVSHEHEHDYGDWVVYDDQYHKEECDCGYALKAQHTWNRGFVTKEPTTTEDGVLTYTCTVCNHTKTEVLEKLPDPETATIITVGDVNAEPGDEIVVPVVISRNDTGLAGLTLNFTYNSDVLAYLGAAKGEALPDLELTKPGTMFTEGNITFNWDGIEADSTNGEILLITFRVKDSVYGGNYNVNVKVKTACDFDLEEVPVAAKSGTISITGPEAPPHEHEYIECEKIDNNNHIKECDCGDAVIESHTWDECVVTIPATCTKKGTVIYTCSVCNGTRTEKIPTVDHNLGEWEDVQGVCHRKKCICGALIDEKHTWDDGVITTPPSETEIGIKTYTCSVCGGTKKESIVRPGDNLTYPTIGSKSVFAAPGDEITVPVKILNNKSGLTGLELSVGYDPEVLTLTGCEQGEALAGLTLTKSGDMAINPYILLWDGTDADSTNGTIALLRFKVADDAVGGRYKIKLTVNSACDRNLNDVFIYATDGYAEVLETIKVTFYEGFGQYAYKIGEVNPTLSSYGRTNVEKEDIPSDEFPWTGYSKEDYMPEDYDDYTGNHKVNPSFWYRNNGKWERFDENVYLSEDTDVYLLYNEIAVNAFGTAVAVRYGKWSRMADTVKTFFDKAIPQLEAAKNAGMQMYEDIADSILGMLEETGLIDEEKYINKIMIELDFVDSLLNGQDANAIINSDGDFEITSENLELLKAVVTELQNITFDAVLEENSESVIHAMIALIGYDICEAVFDGVRFEYCNKLASLIKKVEQGTVKELLPSKLTMAFDPIDHILKPLFYEAELKAIDEFYSSVRYEENPYLQYVIEDADIFDRLLTSDGTETDYRTEYQLKDLITCLEFVTELLIAADDALLWYDYDGISSYVEVADAMLAETKTVYNKFKTVINDPAYSGKIPEAIGSTFEIMKKIKDMISNIDPNFKEGLGYYVDVRTESMIDEFIKYGSPVRGAIRELVESGELYTKIEEFKNSSMGQNFDTEFIDDLIEVIENLVEHGIDYYRVETTDDTILDKYEIEIGGRTFSMSRYLTF